MKIIERKNDNVSLNKSVTYFGYQLLVPRSTTHLATDSDGQTYAYIGPPEWLQSPEIWHGNPTLGYLQRPVAYFDMSGVNPRNTLVDITK